MRRVMDKAREFADRRGESTIHTGHLLYGIFATGANRETAAVSDITDGAQHVQELLAQPLPGELVQTKLRRIGCSDACATSLEHAIRRARARGSMSISVSDIVAAVLLTAPNVGGHLLEKLGVDLARLHAELVLD